MSTRSARLSPVAEWRLFDSPVPHVSTAEFHADRDRARHLEDPTHQPRLTRAAELVADAAERCDGPVTISDLGCGDGGLLSLVSGLGDAWGYDFQPANVAGWVERQVRAEPLDAFGADRAPVRLGAIAVTTEVLEHLADPHGTLRWIHGSAAAFLVASSPADETPANHDECHAWAWDEEGYAAMITAAGFRILTHDRVGRFQLVLAAAA